MEKNETLEEAKQRILDSNYMSKNDSDIFEMGVKWQEEISCSIEEVKNLLQNIVNEIELRKQNIISNSEKMTTHLLEGGCIAFESSQDVIKELFEQFKKK